MVEQFQSGTVYVRFYDWTKSGRGSPHTHQAPSDLSMPRPHRTTRYPICSLAPTGEQGRRTAGSTAPWEVAAGRGEAGLPLDCGAARESSSPPVSTPRLQQTASRHRNRVLTSAATRRRATQESRPYFRIRPSSFCVGAIRDALNPARRRSSRCAGSSLSGRPRRSPRRRRP